MSVNFNYFNHHKQNEFLFFCLKIDENEMAVIVFEKVSYFLLLGLFKSLSEARLSEGWWCGRLRWISS